MTERVTSLWLSEPGEGDRDPVIPGLLIPADSPKAQEGTTPLSGMLVTQCLLFTTSHCTHFSVHPFKASNRWTHTCSVKCLVVGAVRER